MKNQARKLALEGIVQIEKGGTYSNLLLHQLFRQNPTLDQRDKALITQLVYGTVQHYRYLDFVLKPFLSKPIERLDTWVKQLLRMSVFQFYFLDRVPERAVVHEAVELAKVLGHKGIASFVNGVLRNVLRSPKPDLASIPQEVERLAVETSHPTWMVKRWVKQFGLEATSKLCHENNIIPQMSIRVNQLNTTREQLAERLREEGFETEESKVVQEGLKVVKGGNVTESQWFKAGHFTVQDESSMLVASLLAPEKGMRVLDACAAPGGKTTHLAELMENSGQVLAVDLHPHKERLIKEQIQRLGLTNVATMVADARKLPDLVEDTFDRILLDAPCSGFGVIRRKPDLKWKKQEQDNKSIAQVQQEILSKVALLLKPGGQLVYSTCTLEKEENQEVLERFLEQHPSFSIVEGATQTIFPFDFGSDGFFMTKIERNGDGT